VGKKMCILGAGGFARETLNIFIDSGRETDVVCFFEENCRKTGQLLNGKVVRDISTIINLDYNDVFLVAAIGSTKRKRLIRKLENDGFTFDTIIHPNVVRSRWVDIGAGSIFAAGVIMTCQIHIGQHVIANLGAHIGHDVVIGSFTTISPGAELMGFAQLGEQVYVGTNATVIERVKVGNGAVIAAGAVVTKDVPEMALVAGVPASVKKIYKSIDEKPW